MTAGASCGLHGADQGGFTLIEVMVALVIVAFGMGAVLAALSSAAGNITALHDKTLAQWVALNQVADTRLSLQIPTTGASEGDVKAFGNSNWHWRQDIVPVPSIPGLLEIIVRVQRTGPSSGPASSSSSSSSSGSSLLKGSSGFGSSSGSVMLGFTTSSSGSSFGFSSSSGGTFGLSSSSGTLDDRPDDRRNSMRNSKLLPELEVVNPSMRCRWSCRSPTSPSAGSSRWKLLELLELAGPELGPVRCTRTMISSKPGIGLSGTISWRQCRLPNAFTSPSLAPVVGICRLRRVSATLIECTAPASYRALVCKYYGGDHQRHHHLDQPGPRVQTAMRHYRRQARQCRRP